MTADLVRRAQAGEHRAFEALVREPFHRLYAVAQRILRDPYAAEDAVQDALVHAWRDIRGLRDPARFDAWLYRLLVNACRDQGRRARRRVAEVPVELGELVGTGDGLAAVVDRDELDQAFAALSVDHRAALVLAWYAGFTSTELAVLLGVPEGTVRSRLHYGAAAMRAALSPTVPPVAATPEHSR